MAVWALAWLRRQRPAHFFRSTAFRRISPYFSLQTRCRKLPGRRPLPFALRRLPARHRKARGAAYRFARLIDDIGDEAPPDDRGRLFDLVDRDIDRIYGGGAPELAALAGICRVGRGHGSRL